jgi:dTDP-4-dehydrorhamnose 3,5-epimerase
VRFIETSLQGSFVIELEKNVDNRGYFARTWCVKELEDHNLESRVVQCSTSFNKKKGTLRGMHFQAEPFAEVKIVRCTRGAIFDVIVDLRSNSPTYLKWFGETLSEQNGTMIYLPQGFAHGFQTLEDETEVFYQISDFHRPEAARGARWNDPAFSILWPTTANRIISDRDQSYPDLSL